MKVILIDELRGLGSRGDVVTVKDGYARNFLIPKKLAREATAGNLKSIEQERKKWAQLASQERDAAQKSADSIKGVRIAVHKRIGDNGHLFGSVTTNDIADALAAKGITIDKRRIELSQPIKTSGMHDVEVRLHRDVTAHVQIEVLAIGATPTAQTAPAAAPQADAAPAAEAGEAAAE
jgi:large subunit ribosomal protein L9